MDDTSDLEAVIARLLLLPLGRLCTKVSNMLGIFWSKALSEVDAPSLAHCLASEDDARGSHCQSCCLQAEVVLHAR